MIEYTRREYIFHVVEHVMSGGTRQEHNCDVNEHVMIENLWEHDKMWDT